MYLKQIELIGFKSFADKTIITPQPGISCIVGPNGSGKSNISDAIRWVLGEQSAKNLRGGSLADVIFSGSKGRKPLGMAEVILTLDNSDGHLSLPFAEITVSRRNFRSGQSEYLINGQNCRLKDVHSLFVDSGIGLDGISLISQGQISELIAAKPEERRVLIEEAAGIIKYRNRKKEALKKLEDTQTNLERLKDIIGELSLRVEPLEQESTNAKSYLELKEKCNYYEINLSGTFLKELHAKLNTLNEQLGNMENIVLADNTRRLVLDSEASALQTAIAKIDESVNELQKEFYELQNKKEKHLGSKQVLLTQKKHAQEALVTSETELLSLRNQTEDAQSKISALRALAASEQLDLDGFKEDLHQKAGGEQAQKQHLAFLEQNLEQKKALAFDLASSLANIHNKLHYEEQLKANAQAKVQRLTEQKTQLVESTAQNEEKRCKIQSDLLQLQNHRTELKVQQACFEQQQLEQTKNLSFIASQETAARFDYNSLESRYNTMREMQSNLEGFYPGVKAIMRAAQKGEPGLDGVIDIFASLITVPKQYSLAIETYLGNALQDIVCRNDTAAKAAIAYLKKIEAGRATFLPLNTLTPRMADLDAVKDMKGVLGKASDLIQFPPDIKKAVDFLLGRALITENINIANEAAGKLGFRYAIITLDGDIVNPGGSMSGGSRNKKSNELLSRKTLLEENEQKLANFKVTLDEWQKKLLQARSKADSINSESKKLDLAMSEAASQMISLQKDEQALIQTEDNGYRRLAETEEELDNITQELQDIDIESEELNSRLQNLNEENELLNKELDTIKQEFGQQQYAQDNTRENLAQYRIELARKQEALTSLQKDIARQETDCSDLAWDQENKEKTILTLQTELQDLEKQLQNSEDETIGMEQMLQETETTLSLQRHGLSAELENLRNKEAETKTLITALDARQKELYALQIKKARMEADWENEETKLKENFEMSFTELEQLPTCELSKKELHEQVSTLKKAISVLGTVNLNAIEQYKEVSERYAFLSGQEQDLSAARTTLDKVIREMDGIMSTRFKEAYQSLSLEFNKAFNKLFMGGNASLILTSPENILETGVELEVHLPGKKVSNYNLLSGGEKSLIGIALMFAVLAVRPTPFCVMDEVDAALDEANVDRFAAYLRELAQNTQFLMISHRQGTMEVASCLWGVTMQDSGISKLISVHMGEQPKNKA